MYDAMVIGSKKIRWFIFGFALLLGGHLTILIVFEDAPRTSLNIALEKAANNRMELEKVLRYYQQNPADSLKYKAACFLIENMPYYSYPVGKQLENYKLYFNWLRHYKRETPQQLSDSIRKVFGPMEHLEKRSDICEVDSAYLCHNIEWAFKVWKGQPWGKHISFSTFCEYMLPYRIDDEPLEYWREMYYNKFDSLLEPLRNSDSPDKEDPVAVANYLIQKLPYKYHYYTGIFPYSFGHVGARHVQYLTGSCREVTDFAIYLFRSLGIPCAIDFMPMRDRVNVGHFWLVCWDKNGEEYMTDFPRVLSPVCKHWWYNHDNTAKIYRSTFSVNRKFVDKMMLYGEEIYPFWKTPKFVDVTDSYTRHKEKDVEIPASRFYRGHCTSQIAYLCLSCKRDWIPVDWTPLYSDNIVFHNVRKGGVMRVATYEDGNLCFLTDPFYQDSLTNDLRFYSCEEKKHDVILYAKYNLENDKQFIDRMLGGVFEGSNQRNFSKKDTLFIIRQKPFRLNTTVKSWTNKRYRYVRYVGYKNTNCNIAEVAFYGINDSVSLKGKIIGTPGCYQRNGSHEYTNVFDGKSWTSFDYKESTGGWAGLDLGVPTEICKIVYTPRNRDNYIRPGDIFELFYCDKDWKSAGEIQAVSDSLAFRNIPQDALLLLCNYTRGTQERIFAYENGVQEWK
ncbi:hypothetical protein QR305_01137 [Bacteroides finegoldii]|uniref:Transglutaminase-like domain-containing protein n=1 Tax=Bacteroides finegoldii CL09T03C10 TaxID=997888 RepID=K5D8A3_9BACE|nr:transglutaminase-like domain-containing protein [Bacteroides finegoldii]EKJ89183.1 hypothetical protein HMPREF1057_03936 [Bacteroides finegoldii CL09T03C10]